MSDFRVRQIPPLLLAAAIVACSDDPGSVATDRTEDRAVRQSDTTDLQYVGVDQCGECHSEQVASWRRSHHAHAMAYAEPDTVAGDFDQARFEYGRYYAEFFVRDDRYWLRTNDLPKDVDANGIDVVELEVLYTFGFEPLQQYLVETRPGRLQAFNIASTSGNAQSAWFDLYEGEQLDQNDPLQWSSDLHNWNSRCASCHVTDFRKNFDRDTLVYASEWEAINVSCEACHGPGSAHAAQPATPLPVATAIDSSWVFGDAPIALRLPGTDLQAAEKQVEACAACHSRRAQLAPHQAGMRYLDAFEPALLTEGLYHADGQILDEVFVYGSFAQSAMYAGGVACTDCHEPHSGELRAPGDTLCAGCHRADVFAVPEHHRHAAGARPDCVDCHMPATIYMGVDPRRDHSFRVPRPDLTLAIDTPNACTGCHRNQDAQWAQTAIERWYPEGRWREPHYGEAISAGRRWTVDRRTRLVELVYDELRPPIVRATALRVLARQLDGTALDAIEFATRAPIPLLQLAGLQALEGAEPGARLQLAQRFLDSELRALRINAARVLSGAEAGLSERRRQDFAAAIQEYAGTLDYNADSSEGLVGTGLLAAQREDFEAAQAAYRSAIARNPAFVPAYINLADVLRIDGAENEANALLANALDGPAGPDPGLLAALGLSHVRLGNAEAALAAFARATELAPDDPYHAYSYGLALASLRTREEALGWLEDASNRLPAYAPILIALATMSRDAGRIDAARDFTARLLEISPGNASGVALARELAPRREAQPPGQ
ncbi:MAG: cytochrome c3 family protein [Gammaproteobacteria bacterium]